MCASRFSEGQPHGAALAVVATAWIVFCAGPVPFAGADAASGDNVRLERSTLPGGGGRLQSASSPNVRLEDATIGQPEPLGSATGPQSGITLESGFWAGIGPPAPIIPDVEEISIVAFEELSGPGAGWHLEIEVIGSDIIDAIAGLPGGGGLVLEKDPDNERIFFGSDPPADTPGLASFAAFQGRFPSGGGYSIFLNGGARSRAFTFEPTEPNGIVTLQEPSDLYRFVSSQPAVVFTQNCANCTGLLFEIETDDRGLGAVAVEREFEAPGLPVQASIPYAEFANEFGTQPLRLPSDLYQAFGAALVETSTILTLSGAGGPVDAFDFSVGSIRETIATFRVEPPLVELVAFQALGGPGQGWHFQAEVEGRDISDAALVLPDGASRRTPGMEPMASDGSVAFVFSDPPETAPGFSTLQDLFFQYPIGDYRVELDGGSLSATLAFGPVAPDGTAQVLAPANGASDVRSTPTVDFGATCGNCTNLAFEIEDEASGGDEVTIAMGIPAPVPTSASIPYAGFTDAFERQPAALADGRYRLLAAAGTDQGERRDFETPTLDGFDYVTGAVREAALVFTVPEPPAGAAMIVALVVLAVLHRCSGGRNGRIA